MLCTFFYKFYQCMFTDLPAPFPLLLYIDDLCFITFILEICPFLSVDTVSFLFLPLFKLACLMPPQK